MLTPRFLCARYTPDGFEQDGTADGDKVSEWKNVANICYQGFQTTAAKTSNGVDIANQCTYAKKSNSQTVALGNRKHVEALRQLNPKHQPIYKKGVINGHGEPHPASSPTSYLSLVEWLAL
jgi:hypothetical protein